VDASTLARRNGANSGRPHPPSHLRFVALGDSFTAIRDSRGGSWVEELADSLRSEHSDVAYRNLAQPGATSRDVIATQLPVALAFRPDVVSVVCGVNDVLLTPQPDIGGYASRLRRIIERLQLESRARVVTATCPDHQAALPLNIRARTRLKNSIDVMNEATRTVARRLGVPCVEFGRSVLPPPGSWDDPAQESVIAVMEEDWEIAAAFRTAVASSPRQPPENQRGAWYMNRL
jgi:lysophospholipase L1-like esterase